MTQAKDNYIWRNCVCTHISNPNGIVQFPSQWLMCKRKFIIIRECFATFMNSHVPHNYQIGDVCLHASFVWETPNQYCCLVNSQNMKKKCFEVLGDATEFRLEFRTIDGVQIFPESYLFDYCLKMSPN
jgi:hypothetical protein